MSEQPANRQPSRSPENVRRRMRRSVIADWRGVYVPPDLTGYERKIDDVVGRIMKRTGVEDRLTHDKVAADWEATVGEFLFKHSRPVSLRRGILIVAVLQAAVRYDLERRYKRDILARLHERYGAQKVRDVRFQNG